MYCVRTLKLVDYVNLNINYFYINKNYGISNTFSIQLHKFGWDEGGTCTHAHTIMYNFAPTINI